jgi:DNA-binding response OmpR family regulator
MQSPYILIAQADGKVGDRLAANLRSHFREIRVVGLLELQEKLQHEEPYAVIVDLELVDFQKLHEICEWHRKAAIICTHRLADDEMWAAALAAGAADCCEPTDIIGILRAASNAHFRRFAATAA